MIIHVPRGDWDDSWEHVKLLAQRCSIRDSSKGGSHVNWQLYLRIKQLEERRKEWLVLCLTREGRTGIMVLQAGFQSFQDGRWMKSTPVLIRKLMSCGVLLSLPLLSLYLTVHYWTGTPRFISQLQHTCFVTFSKILNFLEFPGMSDLVIWV